MLQETPFSVLENASGSLKSILQTVEDQAARAADYIAPTSALQVQTIEGSTNVILEAEHGQPTQSFKANDVAFTQLAENCNIDVRTARRLRDNENYSQEFDALLNKIFQNLFHISKMFRKLYNILSSSVYYILIDPCTMYSEIWKMEVIRPPLLGAF